jgi:hypothetical protein
VVKALLAAGAQPNSFVDGEAERMKCEPILELIRAAAKK